MELKPSRRITTSVGFLVLIVLYGIETLDVCADGGMKHVLIVLYGIETALLVTTNSVSHQS